MYYSFQEKEVVSVPETISGDFRNLFVAFITKFYVNSNFFSRSSNVLRSLKVIASALEVPIIISWPRNHFLIKKSFLDY